MSLKPFTEEEKRKIAVDLAIQYTVVKSTIEADSNSDMLTRTELLDTENQFAHRFLDTYSEIASVIAAGLVD